MATRSWLRGAVLLGLCFVLALAPGCGTLLGYGFSTTIHVTSEPGAQVLLDGSLQGTAPCEFELGYDKNYYRLTVRKEGFQDASVTIERRTSVNIMMVDVGLSFFTLCLPLIIDGAFGDWYYYSEKNFNLPLRRVVVETGKPPKEPTREPATAERGGREASSPGAAAEAGTCAACGASIGGKPFCPECGAKQPEKPKAKFCGACGAELKEGAKFCEGCGAKQ
ncbi:MAG: zinc-ribbon domain-containing protein [Planctomycetota bacterium]